MLPSKEWAQRVAKVRAPVCVRNIAYVMATVVNLGATGRPQTGSARTRVCVCVCVRAGMTQASDMCSGVTCRHGDNGHAASGTVHVVWRSDANQDHGEICRCADVGLFRRKT